MKNLEKNIRKENKNNLSKYKMFSLFIILTIFIVLNIFNILSIASEYSITTNGVLFRNRPEINRTNIIGDFSKGVKLTVIRREGDWYYVKRADGIRGYVYGQYLEKGGSESQEKPKENNENTNINNTSEENNNKDKEKEKDKDKDKEIEKDKKTDIIDENINNKKQYKKIKIKEDLELYSFPIYFSNKVGNIKKDEEVEFIGKRGIWAKIKQKENIGWVLNSDLN